MRTLFILLLSCVSCFAQFGVEQPMFQSPSVGFTPPSSGMGIWHKPETLPAGSTGDDIQGWPDSSGANNYATNTSAPATHQFPKLCLNSIDSKSGVTFGPSDYKLFWYSNSGPSVLRNVPGATAFIVINSTNLLNSSFTIPFYWYANTAKARFSLEIHSVSELTRIRSVSLDADTTSTAAGAAQSLGSGNWFLVTVMVNYTNRAQTIWTNGVQMANATAAWTAGNTSDTDSSAAVFGEGLRGRIVEFLLYSIPVTASNRREIETNYFKIKYPSIPIN